MKWSDNMQNIVNHPVWIVNRSVISSLMTEENLVDRVNIFPTKYMDMEYEFLDFKDIELTLESYNKEPMSATITKCTIKKDGVKVAEVKRNYGHFPFLLIKHSNGKRYLLCGESYQGYTIVNVDTGELKSFVPSEAKYGAGLCIVEFVSYNDSTNKLITEACVWGGDPLNVVYDISNPETLPWEMLSITPMFPENIDENEEGE
jgi:hypothetical protein